MKCAILLSGNCRTLASCFPNAYWHVLRHFPNASVFASFGEDAQAASSEVIRTRFPKAHIEIVAQPEFPEAAKMAEGALHSGYPCSAAPQNVMRAFWHYKRVWGMIPEGQEFDVYVRIRPDLWFQEYEPPTLTLIEKWECLTAPWGSYGGINDRFAIMGWQAAQRYFTAFDRIGQLLSEGCPFHPETLTRAAVEQDGVAKCKQTLISEFKIRRMGSVIHPQLNPVGGREWLVPEPILGIEIMRSALTDH